MEGFATPLNTTGMGDIDPMNEPLPIKTYKKKKRRKRRMKNIAEFIKESLISESISADKIKYEEWSVEKLSKLFNDMKLKRKDIEMFTDNYEDIIKEYNFEIEEEDFEGISELTNYRKFKELDFDKDKVKELFDNTENADDINKIFWFDNGNGIRSIIIETKFHDKIAYNVFAQDDFEDILVCFKNKKVKSEPEFGFFKYGYKK